MPGPVVCNPPSQQRANDRAEHGADAEDRHGHAVLLGWKRFEKNGLGDRLKGAASQALKDSEKNKALEVPGRTAHERAKGEQRDGKDKVAFSAKEPAQPPCHG